MKNRRKRRHVAAALAMEALLCGGPPSAAAADTPSAVVLPAVKVEAARLEIPPFDLPLSFSAVGVAPGDSGKPGVNLSEALVGVPGVLARDRQNYAQDEQLSIRGFGARATFGVRGVRLYADGIPATMPDGQGQLSHFSLGAADRLEVLRGPFSALYGNSSGGVVQLWSAPGEATPHSTLDVSGGSDGALRLGADTHGIAGPVNYSLALSHFRTDGYRAHSRAQRESGNARFGFDLGQGRQLVLVVNTLAVPGAQDPLGLTAAQWHADPRQAPAVARQYDTRKSVHQSQAGAVYEQPLGGHDELRAMAYAGRRGVRQVLSIPPGAQASPLSAGGVVDLAGGYGGLDLRWTHRGRWLGRPLQFVLGGSFDAQDQQRRGYENFVGDALGVRGRLRRDEDDRVANADQYAQGYWRVADRWTVLLGARRSRVRFRVRDRYAAAGNPDDSGRTSFGATTPVAGVQYRPGPHWRLHASVGEGFETPTFAELGYRADGGAGLALGLHPARSRNAELGLKWRPAPALELDAALFRADSRNELGVASNLGGRSTYRNIGRTRRQGAELELRGELGRGWRLALGLTRLQATVRSAFLTCAATPCPLPDVPVRAGARIPGVPQAYGSLRLERGTALGWRGGLELDGAGSVIADDRNSARAPGYLRTAVDIAYGFALHGTTLRLSARIDNLFDRRIVGSVIVNDGNGRYYEPAPGRGATLGVRLDF
ncbi:TonB-dependent receptor [Frateuria sp. Soil773]|uniref:TonB-dependent receptor family protein n=1 Tax=Frateuria sp. Soil773 TaxID=1736407 RepID=UPI0012FBE445|nr:TonB-dependent receptor [Frateuria sp. Soil773]